MSFRWPSISGISNLESGMQNTRTVANIVRTHSRSTFSYQTFASRKDDLSTLIVSQWKRFQSFVSASDIQVSSPVIGHDLLIHLVPVCARRKQHIYSKYNRVNIFQRLSFFHRRSFLFVSALKGAVQVAGFFTTKYNPLTLVLVIQIAIRFPVHFARRQSKQTNILVTHRTRFWVILLHEKFGQTTHRAWARKVSW